MAVPRHLRLVPSSPAPNMPGILHAHVDPRSGDVDIVPDAIYRTIGTGDDAELAAAEAAGTLTIEAASAVLRDAHVAHRVDPDGVIVPTDGWESAHRELTGRGWTILAD